MIFGRVRTSAGVIRVPIRVSIVRSGLPQFRILGIPQASELEKMILAGLRAADIHLPPAKITIFCDAPTNLKVLSIQPLGLAMCAAILNEQNKLPQQQTDFVGNVSIDGSIFLSPDDIPLLFSYPDVSVSGPKISSRIHAALGKEYVAWHSLRDMSKASGFVFKQKDWKDIVPLRPKRSLPALEEDHLLVLALIWAGGHNTVFFGSPGEGKTLSRYWLESLSPDFSLEDSRVLAHFFQFPDSEMNRVLLPPASDSLTSWQKHWSGWLARGSKRVLWIDELPHVSPSVRSSLRSWMESSDQQTASWKDDGWSTTFVATMNVCPCGSYGEQSCVCSAGEVRQHLKKVSWPLLERFSLQLRIFRTNIHQPADQIQLDLNTLKKRIRLARQCSTTRAGKLNAQCSFDELSAEMRLDSRWKHRLRGWSLRRQLQFLQVAQTLKDGEWEPSKEQAFQRAWHLCRGLESIRSKL